MRRAHQVSFFAHLSSPTLCIRLVDPLKDYYTFADKRRLHRQQLLFLAPCVESEWRKQLSKERSFHYYF